MQNPFTGSALKEKLSFLLGSGSQIAQNQQFQAESETQARYNQRDALKATKIYHKDHQIICESIVQIIDKSSDWIKAAVVYFASENNRCSSIAALESMKQTMIETQIK